MTKTTRITKNTAAITSGRAPLIIRLDTVIEHADNGESGDQKEVLCCACDDSTKNEAGLWLWFVKTNGNPIYLGWQEAGNDTFNLDDGCQYFDEDELFINGGWFSLADVKKHAKSE